MPKKTLHHPDLAEDLNLFLEELCEKWDFCAGVKGADLLKDKKKPLTSKRFTDTVILAEGMDLESEHQWQRRIKLYLPTNPAIVRRLIRRHLIYGTHLS